MSSLPDKKCEINTYNYVTFFVSNAEQASFWYCFNFNFARFAGRRTRHTSEIAIRKETMVFVFKCSISPEDTEGIGREIGQHGDFVKDVAFQVDNLDTVLQALEENGLKLLDPKREIGDADGRVLTARMCGSAGSIVHTLVQNIDFQGPFLPGFRPLDDFPSPLLRSLPSIPLLSFDHIVEGHPEGSIDQVADWYQRILGLRRFWSIDDDVVRTEHSALRALLVGNGGERGTVKMTLVEPAKPPRTPPNGGTQRKGQIQEFLDFHGSPGIQHIAFLTNDIIRAVELLRQRGVQFLDIPDSYYDLLKTRLAKRGAGGVRIREDLNRIRELRLLLDFDERGYLLQIFTKPVQDRMTFFLEVIQRHNFNGFGAGNFAALFEAVELSRIKGKR